MCWGREILERHGGSHLVIVPSYVLSFPPKSVPKNTALTARVCLTRQVHTQFSSLEICASKRTNNTIPFHLYFCWTCKWNLQARMINCISWLDSVSELLLPTADYVNFLQASSALIRLTIFFPWKWIWAQILGGVSSYDYYKPLINKSETMKELDPVDAVLFNSYGR